ncbi:MAG: transglutaminase-like domain-containing protein, partial [Myxococcota bacterium]
EGRPYWRGLALDDFDGTRWRTSATPDSDVVPPALPPLPVPTDLSRRTWTVDVQMVEGAEGRLFLPGKLLGYAGPAVRRDALGSWTVLEGEPLAFVAWVDPFADRQSVAISEVYTPPEAPLDPRIVALAQEVAGAGSAEERVARLTEHLRTEYPYARRTYGGDDPLVEFLFERQGGHCEYFASALAVMVRAIGLPSRVVNGFVGGEQNPVTGQWVVRRRDAHSWVEVALPEQGWVLFDPTPLGDTVPGSGFGDLTHALASTWRSTLEWDGRDQAQAAAVATSLVTGGPGFEVRGTAIGFGVVALLVAGTAVASGLGARRRRRNDRPGAPPSRWVRLLARARRALGRAAGRPVPASLTPRAAVAWVETHLDAATAETYAALVDIVYDAVIGGRETDRGHARAKTLLARLERVRRR